MNDTLERPEAAHGGQGGPARRRGRPRDAGAAVKPSPRQPPGGETLQISIRLSEVSDRLLDQLVTLLNQKRPPGTLAINRTKVLEYAIMDYYPWWLRAAEAVDRLPASVKPPRKPRRRRAG